MAQKISPRQTFTKILNLHCDLDLEHSNPIFPQDTLAYDAVLSNKLGGKPTSSLEDTTVTLTLNTVNQFFCMKLWVMMLHKHTIYGNKMFCGSEDIV